MITVVIPAHDEAAVIGRGLEALLAQDIDPAVEPVEIVVSANGCRDATAAIARSYEPRMAARGFRLAVLDRPEPGKPGALNAADAVARGDKRVYLDADVAMERSMLRELAAALDRPAPTYAGGRLVVDRARSGLTRAYGRAWSRLPFVARETPGAGLFAVNAAGRARWGEFPPIISDDGFVRLLFRPGERVQVAAGYLFPLPEGLGALMRTRMRQNNGLDELRAAFPALAAAETRRPLKERALAYARVALAAPASFLVYMGVVLACRSRLWGRRVGWTEGKTRRA